MEFKNIYLLILLGFLVLGDAFGKSHPGRTKKTHNNRKKNNSWKNNAVPIANLSFIGDPTQVSAKPKNPSLVRIQLTPRTTTIKTTTTTTTTTTTKVVSFELGQNQTVHNLENTLENISPNPFSENPFISDGAESLSVENGTNRNNTSSTNNMLEVINIVPYFKGRSKYSKKFAMIVTLYGVLAMSCIFMAACLIRGIHKRNQRHRQYILLTKRDFDYPVGGGGI